MINDRAELTAEFRVPPSPPPSVHAVSFATLLLTLALTDRCRTGLQSSARISLSLCQAVSWSGTDPQSLAATD